MNDAPIDYDPAKADALSGKLLDSLNSGALCLMIFRSASDVYHNIGHLLGTFLYAISTMHCMTVSLAQGGEGLGPMWGEQKARDYLTRAGFGSIEVNQLPHDIQNNWYVVRK